MTPGRDHRPSRTGKSGSYRDGDDGDLQAGVAWPAPRFVENGENMVLDLLTGLIWHQSPSETTMTWEEAFPYVAGLNTGGYADWRVPTRSELRSLSNYNYYDWDLYLSGQIRRRHPGRGILVLIDLCPGTGERLGGDHPDRPRRVRRQDRYLPGLGRAGRTVGDSIGTARSLARAS